MLIQQKPLVGYVIADILRRSVTDPVSSFQSDGSHFDENSFTRKTNFWLHSVKMILYVKAYVHIP